MGLDLRVEGSEHSWHASYSGVQMHRIKCLLAFAKRLRDEYPGATKTLANVVSCLPAGMDKACLLAPDLIGAFLSGQTPWPTTPAGFGNLRHCVPSYENAVRLRRTRDTPPEVVGALRGLERWVNHSDCEGTHSPPSAGKVLKMLEFISPVLPQDEPWDRKWQDDLLALYADAAHGRKPVRFR